MSTAGIKYSINTDIISRNSILEASKQLVASGLNRGSSGNISVRSQTSSFGKEEFLITPSGISPKKMNADSICRMSLTGEILEEEKPSSEWQMHRDIYASRPEIGAVVHTHSIFATTLACIQKEVPPFHYMIAVTGGNTIPCAPYALFGSQELSNYTLETLRQGYACLLAHHGMLALGHTLDHAISVAIEVESLCEQYWRILQTGHLKILSDQQMAEVHKKFKDYYQK